MTLILALASKDGVIFASDSLATMLIERDIFTNQDILFKYTITKIKTLGKDKVWAASGDPSIIQHFEQYLESKKDINLSFSDEGAMKDMQTECETILGNASITYKRINGMPGESVPKTGVPHAQVLTVGCEGTARDEHAPPEYSILMPTDKLCFGKKITATRR
jgi:hypothetical protein